MSAYDKIPEQSREMIESAARLAHLNLDVAEEMLLMAYNLGRMDGRLQQIDTDERITREVIDNFYAEAMIRRDQRERNEGRPEHDKDTRGDPL